MKQLKMLRVAFVAVAVTDAARVSTPLEPDARPASASAPELAPATPSEPAAPASARCAPSFWLFHIPKTGGATIQLHLASLAKQHAFTYVNLNLFRDKYQQESWPPFDVLTGESRGPFKAWLNARPVKSPVFEQRLLLFRKELRKPRPTFAVHYHHRMPGMNGTSDLIRPLRRYLDARGCDLKVGVVLRDSVDWAASTSRYHTDFDGSHISQKAANTRDGQCRYLLYNTRSYKHLSLPVCDLARADDILRHDVDFVGTTDRLDDFWTCVQSTMTWPHHELPKHNMNPFALKAVSTEDQRRIRERNTLDARLLERHGGKCRVTAAADASATSTATALRA